MVQVMLSLWSLFIEFLGSYSRCRVSSGVMPRVLGPTSFYLKIWVNILTIRMLLCSSSECWCSSGSSSGFINDECLMSFWVCPMRDIRFVQVLSLKSYFSICIKSCWITWDKVTKSILDFVCRREIMDLQSSCPCFYEICKILCSTKSQTCPSLIYQDHISFLLCFLTFHLLYCSQYEACAELNILIIRMFHLFSLRMICKTCTWCNQS